MNLHFGESLRTQRIAVQEYGASNPEMLAELTKRSASAIKVPVYQWALPTIFSLAVSAFREQHTLA